MGGAGTPEDFEKQKQRIEENKSDSAGEKQRLISQLRERVKRHRLAAGSIADELATINGYLVQQINSHVTGSGWTHQTNDPSKPTDPPGTISHDPEDPTISSLLNTCLNFLEEFTDNGTAISHIPRPNDSDYWNHIVTYVQYIRNELSRIPLLACQTPSNPPYLNLSSEYQNAYQQIVNDTDWIFHKIGATFGEQTPPVYGPGLPDELLEAYVSKIASWFKP